MARIAGVDLKKNKRLVIALTSIYGIGRVKAKQICKEAQISESFRTDHLNNEHVIKLRSLLQDKFKVEGDLRREVSLSIKRLVDLNCYRGSRHQKGLPVRGQGTRQNARTRKGPRKTVANKKSVV